MGYNAPGSKAIYQDSRGGKVSNWSDKIVVIGVGISKEDADKIKEIIVEKVDNQP
jgi:nitrogen regulatory protein PII-like uncharacterized protein